MCGGIKTLKPNVRTTLKLAYHGCNNHTHEQNTSRKTHPNGCNCSRFSCFLLFRLEWIERN